MAIQLVVTAQNAKVSLSEELQSEFVREFENESPDLLERVFRAWRRRSKFMPSISEIYDLLEEEAAARWQEMEQARVAARHQEAEAARVFWNDPEQKRWLADTIKTLGERLSMLPVENHAPRLLQRATLLSEVKADAA